MSDKKKSIDFLDSQSASGVVISHVVENNKEDNPSTSSSNGVSVDIDNIQVSGSKIENSEVELITSEIGSVEIITVEAPEIENAIDAEVISNENVEEIVIVNGFESGEDSNDGLVLPSNGDCNGSSADILEVQAELESANIENYRSQLIQISDDSDTSDSDSSSTVSEENEENSDSGMIGTNNASFQNLGKSVRTKGEIGIEDLPPIEDLEISVEETKCREIGTVYCIVDTQVVVQSFKNSPPLDLDTVLFLDRGQRPLGKIFDVLGNIEEPLYAVRFNSSEHIKEKNISKNQLVYCAPQTQYTAFVDTAELLKNKGSDASWRDNNEAPETCLEFSDDDEEVRVKRPSVPTGSKRYSRGDNDSFVKKMNQKNLELTAKRKKEDEAKQRRVPVVRRMPPNVKNPGEMTGFHSPSYSSSSDSFKHKGRSYHGGDQSAASRTVNYRHNSGLSPAHKFDPVSRSVNFLVGGYSSPSSYTFPPQPYLYSSPQQLPNVPNAQNYLTMYSRPTISSANAISSPPPPPPPFTTYASANIAALQQTYVNPQPTVHSNLPSAMAGALPPQFSTFSPLSAPPLPSSLPQTSYYSCTDSVSVHQPTFIPVSMRPTLTAASFHPQFVLPPPPPPPPPAVHHPQHRDLPMQRTDRRSPQSSHQASTSYYPSSPYNS